MMDTMAQGVTNNEPAVLGRSKLQVCKQELSGRQGVESPVMRKEDEEIGVLVMMVMFPEC